MRIPLVPARALAARPAALLVPLLAALLGACDGTSTVEGVLAPSALSAGAGTTLGGAGGVVARGTAPLIGSWTRVSGAGTGVLTEQTFVFFEGGAGARLTVTRTALGVALATEQQPFAWSAGGGVLLLRFQRPGAADTLLRASYLLLVDVTGTVLRLDGLDYQRTGG
jgi:hypothetical protein